MPQLHAAKPEIATNPASICHWQAWLDEHGPALLVLARQWTHDRASAEDLVQEGFLRFWKSREKAADPLAYLYVCIKRCALEWHRSGRRRLQREENTAKPEYLDHPLLVAPIELDERRAQIEAALLRLPESQREVLVMKIWGKLSFPQIAEALTISPDTAASRYLYALAKLREQLAEERPL